MVARANASARQDCAWPASLDAVSAAPKNHRIVLENDRVRVLDVTVQPGERENLHAHCMPSVMYLMHEGAYRDYGPNGELLEEVTEAAPPGKFPMTLWLEPQAPHAVENLDSQPVRLLRIELKDTPSTSATAPAPGYDRLSPLVGRWTIRGREGKYVEACRWYDGSFHIVCETENTRADGTVGRGMSILGYLPDQDRYTYHGIGSKGRNETMSGIYSDGILEFTAEAVDNGKTTISRVRVGPFSAREIPFVAESSADRVSWTTDADFTYVRLE